jgi:hypothetical protein
MAAGIKQGRSVAPSSCRVLHPTRIGVSRDSVTCLSNFNSNNNNNSENRQQNTADTGWQTAVPTITRGVHAEETV